MEPTNYPTNNSKVLVTGGAGLLGEELIQHLLDKGKEVIALVHHTPIQIEHPLLQVVQGDIFDVVLLEDLIAQVHQVYHCAGFVSFLPKQKKTMIKVNIEGTANVVNACLANDQIKLVHVSSVSALGRIREGEAINEKMNWTAETSNSLYGYTKYLGELEVWRGIAEGLNAVIVNPTIILGGKKWESGSMAIFKTAYEEFKYFSEGVSGFVDVYDVANAMILLMDSSITGERFILSGQNKAYRDIFTLIATCFNKRPPYKKVSAAMADFVWRLQAVQSFIFGTQPLLTKETTRTAQAKVYFDNSKILKALPGFSFNEIDHTIRNACAQISENYHL
ncbi:MAG: NAD-dependent epimerase/dehydratase family protein [Bacteroidetes bacterium]|nr:NAD-dependent epimerase/dehydratase family protein [Bacteroidota bacterium]